MSINNQTSALSAPVTVSSKQKRLLPASGLRGAAKGKFVYLSWDNSSQRDFVNYKIYRYNGTEKTLLTTVDKATEYYEDRDAKAGELNSYVITCASKTAESVASLAVSIRVK